MLAQGRIGRKNGPRPRHAFDRGRHDQRVLAFEIPVDGAFGDTGMPGDFVETDRCDPVTLEELRGHVEQTLARTCAFGAGCFQGRLATRHLYQNILPVFYTIGINGAEMLKILLRVAVAIVLLAAVGLGYCAWSYCEALHIDTSAGIDEARFVRIGGIDQWVQIRGDDRRNPVLLWLNGEPDSRRSRTRSFTGTGNAISRSSCGHQRGEGKTFDKSGPSVAPTMTIAQMTRDGIALAEYLRAHLHKNKVVLLGHSWGWLLGMHMVQARPDLFSVYVGTGQIVKLEEDSRLAYPLVLAKARASGNAKAVDELSAAGPPPYPSQGLKKWTWVKWANMLDPEPETTHLSAALVWLLVKNAASQTGMPPGAIFSQEIMWDEILRDDLSRFRDFRVPVVIIEGTEDRVAVAALARAYFGSIRAPVKEYVSLQGGGHLAIFTSRRAFLAALESKVRPLAR